MWSTARKAVLSLRNTRSEHVLGSMIALIVADQWVHREELSDLKDKSSHSDTTKSKRATSIVPLQKTFADNSKINTRSASKLRRYNTMERLDQASTLASLESCYEVDWKNPLGEGTFGSVYFGKDRRSGQPVAIKKIRKAFTDNATFQREMDALLYLRSQGGHPNICGLRENFVDSRGYFLVLDLIQGGELFDHLVKQGPYSEADAARLIREVASALAFMHGIGIVHADLKPENLMLSSDQSSEAVIRVVDFGSSNVNQYEADRKPTANTPAYTPPEIIDGTQTRMESSFDMWSLGVILYIMLTGIHPFDLYGNATDREIQKSIRSGKRPPLEKSALTAHLSDDALRLLSQLLQWDPRKRLSAHDVLRHPWLDSARKEVMADSDKRLSAYNRLKTKLQAKVFAEMVSFGTNPTEGITKRTSLIERSFQMLDPDHRGYVTMSDLKTLLSGEGGHDDTHAQELSLSGFSDLLAQNMKNCYFPKGHIIYHEGEPGHVMYFLNSGKIEVFTDFTKQVRHPGDFFGEGALLHPRQVRSASIRCLTPVHAVEVSREYFEKYLASEEGAKFNLREKDKARKRQRAKTILQLQQNMKQVHIPHGDFVFKTGDKGNEMYILEDGNIDVSVRGHTVLSLTQPGEMCGEHSVIFGRPRNVTAQCKSPDGCRLHVLRARHFYNILDLHPSIKESVRDICFRRDFQKALCYRIKKAFPRDDKELKAAFDKIDRNGSGVIELQEIRTMIQQFDPTYTEDDIREILRSLDLSDSGNLTWPEFLRVFGAS